MDGRHATQRDPRPFAVVDLARAMGLWADDTALTSRLALALRISPRWIKRCRRHGLTAAQADRWATLGGLHPLEVWHDWPHGSDWLGSGDTAGRDGSHATTPQVGDR